MTMGKTDLQLVSTEDLIQELLDRTETGCIFGNFVGSGREPRLFHRAKGELVTLIGINKIVEDTFLMQIRAMNR